MPDRHLAFAVMNRTVNPLVRALLRSPAHGLLGGRVALITVTGRRSGRAYTFPVQYTQHGNNVTVNVGAPARKRWWRNLREGAPVALLLDGVQRTGTARAVGDERSAVTVDIELLDPTTGAETTDAHSTRSRDPVGANADGAGADGQGR